MAPDDGELTPRPGLHRDTVAALRQQAALLVKGDAAMLAGIDFARSLAELADQIEALAASTRIVRLVATPSLAELAEQIEALDREQAQRAEEQRKVHLRLVDPEGAGGAAAG